MICFIGQKCQILVILLQLILNLLKMEVRVKYEVISKATISSISYNHQCDLLALVAEGNDTASFFSLQPQLSLHPRFIGQSKPPSTGHISWSPNGIFIAVANIKVQLWKFEGTRMAPFRVVNQGYIQIKGIAWSQDSKYYVCYGINPKDSPLSVNVRNIETNELKQIITQDTPILVNFDPFGKYIAVLMLKNNIDLYDASTLDKIRSISLAETKNDIPTLRDRRLADWSPQFSYFVCPNLHDSKTPTAVIFDRNKNFVTKDILIGHQSPISCAKFNPQVFQFEQDTTFILAVGDSSGCLSLWRIGKLNTYKQPLFIGSSPDKAEESIEGIQWNSQGNILLINVLKKYIVLYGFRSEDFGRKFSEQQKNNLIISTYGASGVNQITSTRLEVFGLSDFNMKSQQQNIQQPKVIQQTSFNVQAQNKPRQPMVKTKQQTIYLKDANNKQKKRINPSRLIPESLVAQKQQEATQRTDLIINGQISEKPKLPLIKIPSIKQQIKKEYLLPNSNSLIIQNSKNIYILSIKSKSQNATKRFFNGQIKFLTINRLNIYVLNSQKLFIFDFSLKLAEIPCFVGDVSNIAINNEGTLYFLTTNGLIRGFNYLRHQFILQTSIAYLMLGPQVQVTTNPLLMFMVYDEDNERIHVQLKTNLSRYFYSKQINSWLEFDFQQGFYVAGHSLRITKAQKLTAQNFYRNLITPSLTINPHDKNESVVSTSELQLIYYRFYAKDAQKYKDSLIKMLADLKTKGNNQSLRSQIINYFFDKNSASYLGDKELWEKVKKIGGKIIQQFMILQQV